MTTHRKAFFIEALRAHYRDMLATARRAEVDAASAAEQIQAEARKREDAKEAVVQNRLAAGHGQRRQQARDAIESLNAFESGALRKFRAANGVTLGALVDVRVEDEDGEEERTLFVLPVGAGTELNGPGGDGFISVITLESPRGGALKGMKAGDEVEVIVGGRDREWTVVDVC